MYADAHPGKAASPFQAPGQIEGKFNDFQRLPDNELAGFEGPAPSSRYAHFVRVPDKMVRDIQLFRVQNQPPDRLSGRHQNFRIQPQVQGNGLEVADVKRINYQMP